MQALIILGTSILLQLIASILALRLICVTRSRRAWVFISLALFLMAVRRFITLNQLIAGQIAHPPDLASEWVSLVTSLFILFGVLWIAPVFFSIKKGAEALRRSEEKYRSLFEDSKDTIFVTSREGKFIDINRAGLELFGYSRDEMIGMDVHRIYASPEDRPEFQQKIESEGSVRDHEMSFLKKDGSMMDCLLTGTVQRAQDGTVLGYRGIIRDITERKRAEAKRLQAEEKCRSFVENSVEGIFQTVPDGRFLMANPTLARMLGYDSPAELMETITDIENQLHVVPERRVELQRLLEEHGEVHGFEVELYRKDGSTAWSSLNVRAVRSSDGTILYYEGTNENIDERKKTEEESVRLATAIEQVAEGIVITDANGTIIFTNRAFEHISGCDRTELIGERACTCGNRGDHQSLLHGIQTCLREGEVWTSQFAGKRKDGSSYDVSASVSPVRSSSGAITNCVIVERDVTHELQLEKQLRHAQKLEAIGTLAGGIAHDFNNILSAILGFTELALLHTPAGVKVRGYLDSTYKAGNRAKELVNQILAFSRQGEQERNPVQMDFVVRDVLRMLRASLPATIEMQKSIVSTSMIMADPTQIHQILMNLCTNAAHAMQEKGGLLEVSLLDVELDGESIIQYPDLQPGPYVRLAVSDTGHGMDAEVRERIFDPYFTTKGPGEGTGLGLAVVHGIVKSNGGTIIVHSVPDKGSSFHVFLPRIESPAGSMAHKADRPIPVSTGEERILFVDDEDDLCKSGREMLEFLGYKTDAMTSSLEALEAFRAQPDQFDLLITDLTMPKMTGIDLTREMLCIREDLPVILCSGINRSISQEKAVTQLGIKKVLMKPVVLYELAESIRKVLDGNGRKKHGFPS